MDIVAILTSILQLAAFLLVLFILRIVWIGDSYRDR